MLSSTTRLSKKLTSSSLRFFQTSKTQPSQEAKEKADEFEKRRKQSRNVFLSGIKPDGTTRRFYRSVEIEKLSPETLQNIQHPLSSNNIRSSTDQYALILGKRFVETPRNQLLLLPSQELAEAVALEWDSQGNNIKPSSMPLTALCVTTHDQVKQDRSLFLSYFRPYYEIEGICLRATDPAGLVALQNKHWQPLLTWMEEEYDLKFTRTVGGVNALPHPPETLTKLDEMLKQESDWTLAALDRMVTLAKSFIVGWAIVKQRVSLTSAFEAARLEENFNISRFGLVEGIYGHTVDIEQARLQIAAVRSFVNLLNAENQPLP